MPLWLEDVQGMDKIRKPNKIPIIHEQKEDILTLKEGDGNFRLGWEDLQCSELKKIKHYSPRLLTEL